MKHNVLVRVRVKRLGGYNCFASKKILLCDKCFFTFLQQQKLIFSYEIKLIFK